MRRFSRFILPTATFALICFPALAQSQSGFEPPPPRVLDRVDNANLAALKTEVHPLVKRSMDLGPVDGSLALERMTLMLKRSDAQQRALDQLTAEQQDKASPNYHRWLTPTQFGERFGVAQADIDQVTAWLEAEGFTVDRIANGRDFIEFSGTAAQVAKAFHTSIHNYSLDGEAHIANSTTLAMPAALVPVVYGIRSLHDFRKRMAPHVVTTGQVKVAAAGEAQPAITFPGDVHGLGPADFATIYNSQPQLNAGINGTGRTIAVVGRSNINLTTVTNFRALFGLGAGNASVVVNGTDPGVLAQINQPCTASLSDCPERDEALLDNEWSAGVAPGATVKFVISKTTASEDGVDLSEQFIIDNNTTIGADIMTESFGSCEAINSQSASDSVSMLAQQAAAEGITYMVSTGDSGAAGCADPNPGAPAGQNVTPSVNILASTPFTVGVGGTEFDEGCTISADGQTLVCANNAKFWSSTNGTNNVSALSYIPEVVWNEACPATTTGSVTGCGAFNPSTGSGQNLFASGGGASQFVLKPSFQKLAVAGIPAANHRYLPDVSLTAAGHDGYFVCLADTDCTPNPNNQNQISFATIAGTSASTPSFAGIMALVDQKTAQRNGAPHTVIYTLASKETFASCNGSSQTSAPASTCVFNDVTVGNNAVPGETGYGTTSAQFRATAGYDEATGLGSVNVNNFVNNFASGAVSLTATTTTLTVAPATSSFGQQVTFTTTVTGTGGTPTGTVTFTSTNTGVSLGTATLSGGVATVKTTSLPTGTFTVTANYSGDAIFAASSSTAVSVTVNPLAGATFTLAANPTTVNVASLGASGNSAVTVTPTGGFAGTVSLSCAIATVAGATMPTCGVSPGSVTLGAATTATVTFGTVMPTATPVKVAEKNGGWLGASGVAFAGVFLFGLIGRRRRVWGMMLALLMMVAVMSGVGCGGGGGSVMHTPGTTAGTYTATVTGTSGSTTATTTIMVVVP